jgi:hypothetical protein
MIIVATAAMLFLADVGRLRAEVSQDSPQKTYLGFDRNEYPGDEKLTDSRSSLPSMITA